MKKQFVIIVIGAIFVIVGLNGCTNSLDTKNEGITPQI